MSPAQRRLFSSPDARPEPVLGEGDENVPYDCVPPATSPQLLKRPFTSAPRSPSPLRQRAGEKGNLARKKFDFWLVLMSYSFTLGMKVRFAESRLGDAHFV